MSVVLRGFKLSDGRQSFIAVASLLRRRSDSLVLSAALLVAFMKPFLAAFPAAF